MILDARSVGWSPAALIIPRFASTPRRVIQAGVVTLPVGLLLLLLVTWFPGPIWSIYPAWWVVDVGIGQVFLIFSTLVFDQETEYPAGMAIGLFLLFSTWNFGVGPLVGGLAGRVGGVGRGHSRDAILINFHRDGPRAERVGENTGESGQSFLCRAPLLSQGRKDIQITTPIIIFLGLGCGGHISDRHGGTVVDDVETAHMIGVRPIFPRDITASKVLTKDQVNSAVHQMHVAAGDLHQRIMVLAKIVTELTDVMNHPVGQSMQIDGRQRVERIQAAGGCFAVAPSHVEPVTDLGELRIGWGEGGVLVGSQTDVVERLMPTLLLHRIDNPYVAVLVR